MKKLITTMGLALVAAASVQAELVAQWNMGGVVSTDASVAVGSTATGVSSTDMTRLSGGNTDAGWPDALVVKRGDFGWVNELNLAIVSDGYFGFTITPNAGKTISYSDISLKWVMGINTQTATNRFELLTSETGFTFEDGIGATLDTTGGAAFNNGSGNIVLSGVAALQNVATAVEFRLYFYDTGPNPTSRIGIGNAWSGGSADDFVVNGSVIPEPATLGLLGFAAAGMLWFRKRFSM